MDIICLIMVMITVMIMVVNIIWGINGLKKYEETFEESDRINATYNMKLATAFSIVSIILTIIVAIISLVK